MPAQEQTYAHRSLLEKLGVKPEHRVAVRSVANAPFQQRLAAAVATPPVTRLRGNFDIIFLQIDAAPDLAAIAFAAKHLVPNGALWIFHPKGKHAPVSDAAVRAAGLAAGLVDNKISAYTETHTATRYVIPLTRR